METIKNNTKQRYNIDTNYMRIISAFFVVLLHSSGTNSTTEVFFNSISRFSVPVFIIISGYHMLAEKKEAKHIAKKCVRLFLQMLAWSGIYYIYGLLRAEHSYVDVYGLLTYLLTEPVHLWYCYASIALYLFTPVLYVFCKNATKKEYHFALFLTFILGTFVALLIRSNLIPTLQDIIDKTKMPYTLGFLCLYLFGGYLCKYGITSKAARITLYSLGVAGMAITFLGTLLLSSKNLQKDLFLSFFAPNTVLSGAAFFVFLQQLYRFHQNKLRKIQPIICKISECTLGIYFLHPLILMMFQHYSLSAPPYVLIPLKALLAFIASFVVVFIVKQIPVLKRWI